MGVVFEPALGPQDWCEGLLQRDEVLLFSSAALARTKPFAREIQSEAILQSLFGQGSF